MYTAIKAIQKKARLIFINFQKHCQLMIIILEKHFKITEIYICSGQIWSLINYLVFHLKEASLFFKITF